jgi:5'-nucleotidase
MQILLTNDDGIGALGLRLLADELRQFGAVLIVAPEGERSGISHAFTQRSPMRVRPVAKDGEFFGYAIDGTPVDCVKLGLHLSEKKIDWVVSGLNAGANLGVDIFYSGTVQAAVEGTLNGYPSIAFSLTEWQSTPEEFQTAAQLAKEILAELAERQIPAGLCLNVNIPKLPRAKIRGLELTQQAYHQYLDTYDVQDRQDGERDFHLQFGERVLHPKRDWVLADPSSLNGFRTDLEAVRDGKIALTPLKVDWTHARALEEISRWNFKI